MTDSTYLTGLNNRPTPETDAARHDIGEYEGPYPHSDGDWVPASVAANLERQLAEAREQRDRLAEALTAAEETLHICGDYPYTLGLVREALAAVEGGMPWWRKDALGWPIETFKGKPVKSAIRIICQNIRKVICKPNSQAQPPTVEGGTP